MLGLEQRAKLLEGGWLGAHPDIAARWHEAQAAAAAATAADQPEFYPPVGGRCPRCEASNQADNTFCSECSLRLAPGMVALEARIKLSERAWLAAHPDIAAQWAGTGLRDHGGVAAEREIAAQAAQREAAMAEFSYWAQRAAFLDHMTREARTKMARARAACRERGVADADLEQSLGGLTAPGVRDRLMSQPVGPAGGPSARRASSGGAFFFAGSGYDFDGDGDIDGGLIDTVTNAASDVADSAGEAVGGIFDAIGDLFS